MTETIIPGPPQRTASPDVRAARALLARACRGVPTPAVSHAVAEYGPVATLEALRADPNVARAFYGVTVTEDDEAGAGADLDAAAALGARFLVPEDDGWPELAVMGWQRTGSPDVVGDTATVTAQVMGLWVRGLAPLTGGPRVTVTGARAASDYGRHVARDFSAGLAVAGVRVVTGGALGVEAEALRGAVAADGAPVVVAPCGIDRVHPSANRDLFEEVLARGGAIVSPYPPGLAVRRDRVMGRLRLLAGLADAVLVVEAGPRSTALHLADDAHFHGRAVLVVPGPITSELSAGAHRLAREPWAQLVHDVDDVVADLTAHRTTAAGPASGGGAGQVAGRGRS